MPRLDELLVIKGYFDTRVKSKRYIKTVGVIIKDKTIKKPGLNLPLNVELSLSPEDVLKLSKPIGYQKLDFILNNAGVEIFKDDICLDIGASAGGFSLYLLDHGVKEVNAVEISKEFYSFLYQIAQDFPNFKPKRADFFKMSLKDFSRKFSLIVVDLTVDPDYILENFDQIGRLLDKDKQNLRIIMTLKTGKIDSVELLLDKVEKKINEYFSEVEIKFYDSLPDKQEKILVLKNISF